MFGPLLTTYEYDNVLTTEQKLFLASIVQQPSFDVKSRSYRHTYGQYRNGELYVDPLTYSITGYGDPTQPVNLLPITTVQR